ncbi:Endonuclease YncB, thermonuclease family [Filomicrobium insigne]|uniref:Endonuclease YncB, thermonuclease family n=1 Tax=Filomicrobium insigne TaxID=418854 RepID=A0A1H0ISL2_9HYPH|nr:thermonuclease family protein [Filomicrobium insigne]SDO34293.1 Endonuclease YncB, thermonuclease family [Filomicrobium insigne]
MFGWRKRRDGFEWREYVRTTILVRRKKRRERVEEAGKAAIDGLAEAGRRGAAAGRHGAAAAQRGLGQAGRRAGHFSIFAAHWARGNFRRAAATLVPMGKSAAQAAGRASVAAGQRAGRAAIKGGRYLGHAARSSGAKAAPVLARGAAKLGPSLRTISTPQTAMPLAIAGGAAVLGAVARIPLHGFDATTLIAALIGIMLLGLAAFPLISTGKIEWPSWLPAPKWSTLPRQPATWALGAAAIAIVGLIASLLMGWVSLRSPVGVADILPDFSSPPEVVSGYAVSLTGDSMRIEGHVVRLADVEAPELTQTCDREDSRSWNCGQSALDALRRLTGRATISCDVHYTDSSGRKVSTCRNGDTDLAAEMVRSGHIFATGTLFPTYGSQQAEAQSAKAGLWSGSSKSPQDYRDERWEAASRAAPDGCPIKGRVLSGGKVYILPWSRSYDKYSVRDGRGDRWFCSEDEALSDGWKSLDS